LQKFNFAPIILRRERREEPPLEAAASEISENRINPSHGSFVLFEISSTGAVKYLLSISTVVEPGGVLK